MLQAILDLGAKADALPTWHDGKEFTTALSLAASEGHSSCLSLLLTAGAKVNYVNKASKGQYFTALHKAINCKHKECIKILLKNGADPNIKGKFCEFGKSQYYAFNVNVF